MNYGSFSVPEPILQARVAIIREQAEAEREISNKNFRDLLKEYKRSYRLKEILLMSLLMNLVFIATLVRLTLGSGDMNLVSKIGFTVCLFFIGALPLRGLWMLFKTKVFRSRSNSL